MLIQSLQNKLEIKGKYSEYSSEQAVKALDKRSELYGEHLRELKNKGKIFSVLHNDKSIKVKHSAWDRLF